MTNSDAVIEITFIQDLSKENVAPYFAEKPPTPDVIPCKSSDYAYRWKFTLGKIVDLEESHIQVDLKCPLLPFDFFR